MRRNICRVVALALLGLQGLEAQDLTIAEKLGYPKDAKLLILHADDLGVSHAENAASISALEQGSVNSASIMVPCPWFPEIAEYARKNPDKDLGLHLTLTSEWKLYKWGPVTSRDSVRSLVNASGYFYESVDSLLAAGRAEEVAIELRNQVKKAYDFGIDVTHLDAHMGAALSAPDYAAAYMAVGKEFGLPVLLDPRIKDIEHPGIQEALDDQTVILDRIYIASPSDYPKGMETFYTGILKNLSPGLNCLLLHAAYDTAEMQAITVDHPDYGAAWRQADYDFFTGDTCRRLLEEENIILVTWRQLRDTITRSGN